MEFSHFLFIGWIIILVVGLCFMLKDFISGTLIQDGDKIYIAHICRTHNLDCRAIFRVIVPVQNCDVCNAKK